jgi:hypothetical protein
MLGSVKEFDSQRLNLLDRGQDRSDKNTSNSSGSSLTPHPIKA